MTPKQIARKAIAGYLNDPALWDYIGGFIEEPEDLDDEALPGLIWDINEALHNELVNLTWRLLNE